MLLYWASARPSPIRHPLCREHCWEGLDAFALRVGVFARTANTPMWSWGESTHRILSWMFIWAP